MKKIIIFLLFVFILVSCSEPKNDSERVELILKKSSQYSKKRNWQALYQLYSKESSIKIELILKSLFKVLTQTPKFSTDEIEKMHAKDLYLSQEKYLNLSGQEYFVNSFNLLEKYPDYLKQFQSNLRIYESYDIIEVEVLKDKAYILIKTPQNQKEAIFFMKEGAEWKIQLINDTERFA